jgi:hypothetical protein
LTVLDACRCLLAWMYPFGDDLFEGAVMILATREKRHRFFEMTVLKQ